MNDKKTHNPEFKSLNIDDLDIEELESRLELAAAASPLEPTSSCDENNCYIKSNPA